MRRTEAGRGEILSNIVRSQWEEHRQFGGVVPEIAARAHADCLDEIIARALADAGLPLTDIDVIAATSGPGLIGGLLVGLTTAKALAHATGKPLVAVNHLAAHALSPGLTDSLAPPYVLLLVSGGHTQTILVEGVDQFHRLGTTIDDALGEAFDKTAKLLGLGFPGGPAVERHARRGDASRFDLPRPLVGRPGSDFSFAGLKTAVRRQAQKSAPLSDQDVCDLCAAFEAAVCATVRDRLEHAFAQATERSGIARLPLVAAGGVAANARLRERLETFAAARDIAVCIPPPQLCTDNGAMVAWAGAIRYALGEQDGLDVSARARWPLDTAAPHVLGHGKHGAKV